jgi:pimeloyl-ACP methyl ester carboxylesterase
MARGWDEDPLKGAILAGHSFGGMVVKWTLNKHDDPFCKDLRLAVTVGTPFYGNPGQTERLFVSEPALGPFYDLDQVTKVIATLPGGFSLFFLDSETYDTHHAALAADPEFPLDRYPSFDSADNTARVDPYMSQPNHPSNPHLCRYPLNGPKPGSQWTWFQGYLANGLQEYRAVASPLDSSMQAKLHNIRGIQMNGSQPAAETKVLQQWGWYDTSRQRLPQAHDVLKTFGGPGDGVIPAWSSRLVTQPADHIHTVRGEASGDGHLEHMTLMDFPEVRSLLLRLMRPGAVENVVAATGPAPATREEFAYITQHFRGLVEAATTAAAEEARGAVYEAKEALETHLDGLGVGQTRALALRWFIELHKGHPPSAPAPAMQTRQPSSR